MKITNLRTARCVKMMGKGVVKVVHRCDDAKENNNLGEISRKLFIQWKQIDMVAQR